VSFEVWLILVHAMKLRILTSSLLSVMLLASPLIMAQQPVITLPRLADTLLDVTPPSTRVTGIPGSMQIVERTCRNAPLGDEMRRRIVNTAVQEWAFFVFQV
jgi:hypothetical protein